MEVDVKASETKLIKIVEGTNQYLVPHFQRPYTWQRKDWETLWNDLIEVDGGGDGPGPREHFIGAIVTAPAHSVPEGITKYLLIDGQQRLTTMLIVLAAMRERARAIGDTRLADKIHDLYLTNRHQEGRDQNKLLPTQGNDGLGDRASFQAIVDAKPGNASSGIDRSFQYYRGKLRDFDGDRLQALSTAYSGAT